jgi:hypothetical protein
VIHATTHRPHTLPAEPSDEEIQKCAYFLWKEEGSPVGRDLDIWLKARELVRHHVAEPPKRPGPRRRPAR